MNFISFYWIVSVIVSIALWNLGYLELWNIGRAIKTQERCIVCLLSVWKY